MQTLKSFKIARLFAVLVMAGTAISQAQTNAIYTGPATGGDWNTAANWSTGVVPGADANATTNAFILTGTNVTYNAPMTATGFGNLTNYGILAVNASGFNCSKISLSLPTTGSTFYLTNGSGVVTVTGDFTMVTNGTATMVAGTSLTVGALKVESTTSSKASGTCTFTNSGGTLTAGSTAVGNTGGTGTGKLVISGGVNNLGNTTVGRYASAATSTLGATEGLNIFGGVVTMSNLTVTSPSYGTAYIAGGAVTNFGNVSISGTTAARVMRVVQSGGLFVVPDPGIIYETSGVAGGQTALYQVTGGTNIVGGIWLGTTNNTTTATMTATLGGAVYVGSQGIVTNGVVTNTITLSSGGLLGATADWTASAAMVLSSGTFTFQAADLDGTAHSITVNNPLSGTSGSVNKTGAGVLTLNAANTYSGGTLVNGGSLVLGAGASLASTPIIVGSGTTLDVSAVTNADGSANGFGFVVKSGRILSGLGVVTGAVAVASGGTINPGSNSLTGALTLLGSVAETNGGVINHFDLAGAPSSNNDLLVISGDLNVSGTNTIDVLGASLVSGTNYVIIQYGGSFNGDISNFVVTTAIGALSNDAVGKTISFIPEVTMRGATNTVWVGNPANTNWDNEISTNWIIASSGSLDYFVPNDSVSFTDAGASNSPVNIVSTVTPTAVLFNSQSNYVIASTSGGLIGGSASLTVTNTGTVTILTTNTYSGNTTIDGGATLVVSQLASSTSPSAIGEGGLIINNGTFSYSGSTVSVNRSATLGSASSAISVGTSGSLTLSGGLSGGGSLTKAGAGTLILSAASSYSGPTILSNGTLQITSTTAALDTNAVVFNGGTLSLSVSSQQTYSSPLIVTNGTIVSAGGNNNVIESAWSGPGTLNVSVTTNGYFTINKPISSAFTGTIHLTDASAGFLRFNGGGNATGAQQFSGATNVTFDLGNGGGMLVNRNGGGLAYGVYDLGSLTGGTNTLVKGAFNGSGSSAATYYSIGALNQNSVYAGNISNGIVSGGTTAIIKVGTGTLTLSGQNAYTGTTTVSNGVLALASTNGVDGSIASSSPVDIKSGGVLDVSGQTVNAEKFALGSGQILQGNGTVRGILDASISGGGTVSPGGGRAGSIGALTVTGNVYLSSGTAWMKINRSASPNSDRLYSSGGSIAYGGTLVVTNIGSTLQVGDTFTLFTNVSFASSSFDTITLPPYYTFDTSQLAVNGSVTVTAVLAHPKITSIDFSGFATNNGAITITTTNGIYNTYATVIASTNLSLPFSSWTVVTNKIYFDAKGGVTDPNSGNSGLTIYMNTNQTPLFIMLETTGSE